MLVCPVGLFRLSALNGVRRLRLVSRVGIVALHRAVCAVRGEPCRFFLLPDMLSFLLVRASRGRPPSLAVLVADVVVAVVAGLRVVVVVDRSGAVALLGPVRPSVAFVHGLRVELFLLPPVLLVFERLSLGLGRSPSVVFDCLDLAAEKGDIAADATQLVVVAHDPRKYPLGEEDRDGGALHAPEGLGDLADKLEMMFQAVVVQKHPHELVKGVAPVERAHELDGFPS